MSGEWVSAELVSESAFELGCGGPETPEASEPGKLAKA